MAKRKLLGLITLSEKEGYKALYEAYLAGIFLVAQNRRSNDQFKIDVEPYPTLAKCYESYNELSVFQDAVQAKQPDAPAPSI